MATERVSDERLRELTRIFDAQAKYLARLGCHDYDDRDTAAALAELRARRAAEGGDDA